jgi:hypothetical protein
MNTSLTKKLDRLKIPPLAALSIGLSLLQGVLQTWWKAIRYSGFGPRPFAAKIFLIAQGIVLMFVMVEGISAWQVSDHDGDKPLSLMRTPKVRPFVGSLLWMLLAIAAWIFATFVLG